MTTPASLILRKAAERISKPGAWTQRELARNSKGEYTWPDDADAVCWCAYGAIGREFVVQREDGSSHRFFGYAEVFDEVEEALFKVMSEGISKFNDAPGRTASEVAAKMIEAAEVLEREELNQGHVETAGQLAT